jgi:hypothetical protein
MTNKTRAQRLVAEASSLAPPPGHVLVIFKATSSGRHLHGCLLPGERFKKASFLESKSGYFAYAVPIDDELRHRFAAEFRTHDQAYTFTLHLTLDYRVGDPVSLVENVDEDPICRVEEEIGSLLRSVLKGIEWSTIDREPIDLSDILFQGTIERERSRLTILEWIRRFAARYGLEVRRIQVERDLPAQVLDVRERLADVVRDNDLKCADHYLNQLDQRNKLELDARAKAFDRRENFMNQVATTAATATSQSIETVHSPGSLAAALRELVGPELGRVAQVVSGTSPAGNSGIAPELHGGGLGLEPGASVTADHGLLAGPGRATGGGLLAEVEIRFSDPELRSLRSEAVHLLAELLRGTEADRGEVARRRSVLTEQARSLIGRLDREQIALLRLLQQEETGFEDSHG